MHKPEKQYTLGQKQAKLILDKIRFWLDINGAVNAILPFVVGPKNWLFSNSVDDVKASVNLFSLIETSKAHGLEPYAYLRYLITQLPAA